MIEIFCPEKQNFLRMQKTWAARKLKVGAIAFGEHHDSSAARAVILDLALEGAVTKLFIELGDIELDILGIDGHGKVTIGEYLQSRSGIDNLGNDPLWSKIRAVFELVDKGHTNAIPLEALVKNAVEAGVQVFFYDNAVGLKPISRNGMKRRNRTMGDVFRAHSAANDPGAILLVGANHLYPIQSGGLFAHTLQQQCALHFNSVCDLSR